MKVHVQRQQPEFRPTVLSLTITNKDEMAVLIKMFGSNCTISEQLYPVDANLRKLCNEMLSDIYLTLSRS